MRKQVQKLMLIRKCVAEFDEENFNYYIIIYIPDFPKTCYEYVELCYHL